MTVLTAASQVNLSANGLTEFDIINQSPFFVPAPPNDYKIALDLILIDFFSAAGDLAFNGLNPTSGTISSIEVDSSGSLLYSLTGLSVNVVTLLQWFKNGQIATALNTMFSGADTINGSSFADILGGFGGNDTLRGNGGADRLTGGLGRDTLNGGAAADVFIFNAAAESHGATADTVQGFSHLQHDRIDLHRIDATTGGINNAFLFAGTQSFAAFNAAHNGGAVRAVAGLVQVDVDGNNTVDMVIKTPGATLHAGDFIL